MRRSLVSITSDEFFFFSHDKLKIYVILEVEFFFKHAKVEKFIRFAKCTLQNSQG
jgi:hypothetical protein